MFVSLDTAVIVIEYLPADNSAKSYVLFVVVMSAIALFNFFRKLKIQSKRINKVSKNMLGVYLLHTEPIIVSYFWSIFKISEVVNLSIGKLMLNLSMCVGATFVICVIADRCLQKGMIFLDRGLDKVNFISKDVVDVG